jgi:hypothetical protein
MGWAPGILLGRYTSPAGHEQAIGATTLPTGTAVNVIGWDSSGGLVKATPGGGGGGSTAMFLISDTGDGTTGPFTLTDPIAVGTEPIIWIAGVGQKYTTDYTATGDQLTFTANTPSGQPIFGFGYTSLATSMFDFSFTGDGTTGPFVLPFSIAANTELIVFIGGVGQEETADYTVVGDQLTFTANTPNGISIFGFGYA